MSLFEHPETMRLLQDLLKQPDESSQSEDDDEPAVGIHRFGPGDVGPKKIEPSSVSSQKKDFGTEQEKQKLLPETSDDLEKWLQKQEEEDDEILDARRKPQYRISYKQAVGTEDVFLQMSNKTTSSMSCEDMVIEIDLPEETAGVDDMDLKVTETEIDLKTSKYRLKMPLVQKIDPNEGKAKFDSNKKVLVLTMRMIRELDFINF